MKDRIKGDLSEKSEYPLAVSNVQIAVGESACRLFQSGEVPSRVSRRTKKDGPHVVVDPDDSMALSIEVFDGLGANQPTASGHENVLHLREELTR